MTEKELKSILMDREEYLDSYKASLTKAVEGMRQDIINPETGMKYYLKENIGSVNGYNFAINDVLHLISSDK